MGRRKEAEEIFSRVRQAIAENMRDYPQSADAHNALAWLFARCHRDLAKALEHAKTSVTLLPGKTWNQDTLAEVYFHLGKREEAVEIEKKAVKRSPGRRFYRNQLKRFQTAPLPKAPGPSDEK